MSYADPPALTLEKFSLLCVGRFLRKSERAPEDAFGVEDAEDDVILVRMCGTAVGPVPDESVYIHKCLMIS